MTRPPPTDPPSEKCSNNQQLFKHHVLHSPTAKSLGLAKRLLNILCLNLGTKAKKKST